MKDIHSVVDPIARSRIRKMLSASERKRERWRD